MNNKDGALPSGRAFAASPSSPGSAAYLCSALPLRLCAALTALQTHPAPAVALQHLGHPMRRADWLTHTSFSAMQPAVGNCINRFNVFRTAARLNVTRMVYMLRGGGVKRFEDEAMNLFQLPHHSNVTVAAPIGRAGPNPALPVDRQVSI